MNFCRTPSKTPLLAPLACGALFLIGCATTHQARSVEQSGFLRDYSRFEQGGTGFFKAFTGKEDKALRVYVNPQTDWKQYDKIFMDPVTVWGDAGGGLMGASSEDLQTLADYLDASIREQLKSDYEFVDRPGRGVLRLRVALTEAKGTPRVLNVATTAGYGRAASMLKRVTTGTHAFVGAASVEGEILDSLSDERLFAAVDRRAGAKTLKGALSKWNDVQEALDWWSARLKEKLAELRTEKA